MWNLIPDTFKPKKKYILQLEEITKTHILIRTFFEFTPTYEDN